MKLKTEKAVSILLTATLLLGMLFIAIPYAKALGEPTATVRFIPSPVTVTASGQVFTVACVVEDAYNLSGIDIQIKWNTTLLNYVSHTPTVTVEDFPGVQAPSPYAGILHNPKLQLKDEVDGVTLGPGTYWFGFATLGGPGFNGSGTAFVITFMSQNVPFGDPLSFFDIETEITNCDLARTTTAGGGALDRTLENGVVRIYYAEFEYPAWPKLSITPDDTEFNNVFENETIDVILHGYNVDTQTVEDLAAFWDVAGIDMYINFDPTLFQCVEVNVDPDGWFAGFWSAGIFVVAADIDNVAGTVHVAFSGYGEPHTPPYGTGSVAELVMQALVEFTTIPPTSPITIANPLISNLEFVFDSTPGLIDIANPTSTMWHELSPTLCNGPYQLTGWADGDGNMVLSDGDIVTLNHTGTGFYYRYEIKDLTVTLNLTEQPFATVDDYVWAASFGENNLAYNGLPGRYVGTDDPYNGIGVPYWTGNFSLTNPVDSVTQINVTCLPFTGDEYTYTLNPANYVVYPDEDLIELLIPLDIAILNEFWVDGVNNSLNGWPWINYVASGIESVYVDMNNGTARPGTNNGYAMGPPSEWWYDPDWAWELEGWFALGYYCPAPYCWPADSMWWINYTAASYMTIAYNADPDPNPRYLEFMGSYADGLTALTSPNGTMWDEIVPQDWRLYENVGWVDDTDGIVDATDELTFLSMDIMELRTYVVNDVRTDMTLGQLDWICEDDPSDPFFGVAPIVQVAGFPLPDRDYCPWHYKDYSIPIPHIVNDGTLTPPFKPSEGFIDLYVCYDAPFGGQGWNRNASMIWPQKEFCFKANVSYAGWPEQYKDVAIQLIDPTGTTWGIWSGRTDTEGYVEICVRMPWPCPVNDTMPWDYFGTWTVIATVDVACVVYNDTLHFKYDYLVNIWNAETDKDSYKHCEDITVTINYGTYNMFFVNITFAITAVDASGVPFGFVYEEVTIGKGTYGWCYYENGQLNLTVHVEKFARPPIGTIYVVALSGLPSEGGSAETPVFEIIFEIEPEWAP